MADDGDFGREAAFRGRAFKGVVVPTPEGYSGALLADIKAADVADGEERRWLYRGAIDSVTYWKHDEEPTGEEPIFKAMRWAAVADVLHADHGEEAEPPAKEEAVPPAKEEAAPPSSEGDATQ